MSSDHLTPAELRPRVVTSGADAARARPAPFDRPLVEHPGWGDPRLARQVAEATRAGHEQGRAAGYAAGWAQGMRAAAEQAAVEAAERAEREEATRRQLVARAQTLLASLAAGARTLAEQAVPAWDELVDVLVEGALAIAAAGLGRELAALDAEVLEAVRTALRLLPPAELVAVSVNPADAELVAGGVAADAMPAGLTVVPDPTVPPGTVMARSTLHSLPMDLRAALRAAEEVLRP